MSDDCIFCQIVAGASPSHTIWEDDTHVAFLSIFPNTEGVSVVIPKQHYDSYLFDQSDEVIAALMHATKQVARKLDAAFEDVGRTAVVCEGFGINHLHTKLFPLHGTASDAWQSRTSKVATYFKEYPGYVSSHDAARAEDNELNALATKIRKYGS